MKTGIVITTHGNNGIFAIQCLECFLRNVSNAFIVIYVNSSQDIKILNIKNDYPDVEYIYIDDQIKSGGLTGTWNKGIDLCIQNNCEIIILSNDDIFFDHSIEHIIKEASNCKKDEMKYFGPVTNNPGPAKINNFCQLSLCSLNKLPSACIYNNKYVNINGFFMVFSVHVLKNNMYDDKHYFDPNKPFAGNEVEWFERFKKKGGIPVIVPRTFIYHYKLQSWRNKKQNDTCIFTINFGNYEKNKVYLENNTDIDNIYFTDNSNMEKDSQIYNCITKNIMFLYINITKYTSNNWWTVNKQVQRMIKTCPHDYLPYNYTKSIYLDGDRQLTRKIYRKDVEKLLEKVDIVCFDNPWSRGRPQTVSKEYQAIYKEKLENKENLEKLRKILKENNFPDNIGLSETSLLIRNHNNIKDFSNEWRNLIKICIRDQTSFEYLLWKHKIKFKRYAIKDRFTKKKGHANPINRLIK